ncbi:hypothetical protein V5E97_09220 [Singulisphaera sp. Ch08]|uniref:Uncharacterized protein n=1 Tax=Singulisphaera sp. Ch08 TaxID=3120278 RepID=A0AAU7CMR2_9BACT
MGATVPRHALIFRVHRLALAGMTGAWLMAGILGTAPARAGEPGGAQASPEPARADASVPVVAAPRSRQAYLFFPGDRRAPQRPTAAAVARATPAPTLSAGPPTRSYLFFTPGKKSAAQKPASVARQVPPAPASGANSKPAVVGVEGATEGLPLAPAQPRLIFFSPKRGLANSGRPQGPKQVAQSDRRKPTLLATNEPVPVRLPGPLTRSPQPYLIFQPKQARDRRSPTPKAKATSSTTTTTTTPPNPDVTTVVPKPKPTSRPVTMPTVARSAAPNTSRGKLEPTVNFADLPPLPRLNQPLPGSSIEKAENHQRLRLK